MEGKKGKQGKSKTKPATAKQKTLLDLFQRKPSQLAQVQPEPTPTQSLSNGEPDGTAVPVAAQLQRQPSTDDLSRKVDIAPSQSKLLHPLFAKKASVASDRVVVEEEIIEVLDNDLHISPVIEPLSSSQDGGSQHDPIIIDSSPVKPIPTRNFVEVTPLAPIFGPRQPNSGGMRKMKSSKLTEVDAPYPKEIPQHVRGPQGAFQSDIIYPRREKYTGNRSTVFHYGTSTPSSSRDRVPTLLIPPPNTAQPPPNLVLTREAYLQTIPDEHRRLHPAISRVIGSHMEAAGSSSLPTPSHKPWADKWHPTRADEVLGNEANALYLRDWLRALEIQLDPTLSSVEPSHKNKGKGKEGNRGTKRPRIVRAVEKQRGRKKRRVDSDDEDSDDWIVYTDAEEEDEEMPQSDAIHDGLQSGPNDQPNNHSIPQTAQHFFPSLTNTIILVGPPGTGKTAAAYACAQELDWEVFEVYPGIGKRNGASIDSMVGDVGKNHLVRKTKSRGEDSTIKARDAFAALLRKPTAKTVDNVLASEEMLHESDTPGPSGTDFGFVSHSGDGLPNEGSNDTAPIVRQSVILLEEVDILFKDDANFWPAVTNFIKDCKRPVICTCNDISLVPTHELPLQIILYFQPCAPSIVASYLQGLCFLEGYQLDRTSLLQLCNSTYQLEPADVPNSFIPPTSNTSPAPDLRRTINHLQLRCTTTPLQSGYIPLWEVEENRIEDISGWTWAIPTDRKTSTGSSADQIHTAATGMGTEAPSPRELAAYYADLISFVDSYLMRSTFDTLSALAVRSFEASGDDEIGHPILYDPVPANKGIEFNDRDEDIISTVIQCSRGALEAGTTRNPMSIVKNSFRTHELFHARVSHQLRMAEVMRGFVPLAVWTTARTSVYLDYEPCIRSIVAAEDREEVTYAQKERSGRMTRNSRGGYERTFAVSAEMREALDWTLLR